MRQCYIINLQGATGGEPRHLSAVPDVDEISEENVANIKQVHNYKKAVSAIYNVGEDMQTIEQYKKATVEILLGKKVETVL